MLVSMDGIGFRRNMSVVESTLTRIGKTLLLGNQVLNSKVEGCRIERVQLLKIKN